MFENNLIAGVSGQGGGYSIEDSLRFNDNDSAYLSRTPSVAGNRKTWTWSGWVKRGNVGGQFLTAGATSISNGLSTIGTYADSAYVVFYSSASHVYTSPALLRDSSGWYHIVFSIDTTQSTASERVKFYVNGIRFDLNVVGGYTAVPQNFDCSVNNSGQSHVIGTSRNSSGSLSLFFDGYMAEVNFIDGQALTADDFGKINARTGEWSPKAYAGTYGTNGFYLPFDGNANDSSGNGNNWTENNLASTDYMIDTPTNNFCTFNPFDTGGGSVTLSDGNLNYAIASSTGSQVRGTLGTGLSSKWYWEFTNGTTATPSTPVVFGISTLDGQITNNSTSLRLAAYIYTDGGTNYVAALTVNGSTSSIQTQFRSAAIGDVFQVAYDADTGKVWFGKNNVWYDAVDTTTGNPSAGLNPVFTIPTGSAMTPFLLNIGASYSGSLNCGQLPFAYTPPTGYLALCTDNLPAPAIEQPETQFNVVTYTGDGTSSNAITGVGFQPDFVWIKRRDAVQSNILSNSVNGAGVALVSDVTSAEFSIPSEFLSFDSDGFTVGYSTTITNNSGSPYVAWCWKAGGTAVSNTDGLITSQVSANVDAGFSIVSYTATNNSSNVGHGLSQAPELIIFKSRTSVSSWAVYTTIIDGTYDYLGLNSTNAKGNSVLTAPSNTIMNVNNTEFAGTNVGSNNYIAYAFHSVEGFSKFGSYVGNGSANGPFVYTGFKPAFVMIKRTDSTSPWLMYDNERNTFNQTDNLLRANTSQAETGSGELDFLSNGFKYRGSSTNADYVTNVSGGTYIYMAFAEHPFNYATGR